jgi:hypothetical protein
LAGENYYSGSKYFGEFNFPTIELIHGSGEYKLDYYIYMYCYQGPCVQDSIKLKINNHHYVITYYQHDLPMNRVWIKKSFVFNSINETLNVRDLLK